MTQFVEQLRNQAKWYAQPGHNARDLMDSRLLEKAADEIERLQARAEAAEKSDVESITMYWRARDERDDLRAEVESMENQEPFDADSDVFRSAFEAALKAGNWPATRQGDGYRSPSTQIAWRIAFSTVNRLRLYLAPGAKGEKK